MNRLLPSRPGSAEPLDHDGRHRDWGHGPGVASMANEADKTGTGQGGHDKKNPIYA